MNTALVCQILKNNLELIGTDCIIQGTLAVNKWLKYHMRYDVLKFACISFFMNKLLTEYSIHADDNFVRVERRVEKDLSFRKHGHNWLLISMLADIKTAINVWVSRFLWLKSGSIKFNVSSKVWLDAKLRTESAFTDGQDGVTLQRFSTEMTMT